MATHSSTLAWKIPWTEEPGGLQSMRSLSRTRLSDFTFTFQSYALEKEMATHSSVLAWRIPGTGEPGGLPSLGSLKSVMPSSHLILYRPLLLLPSIFPSIRIFSNELAFHIRWPKYWSFSQSCLTLSDRMDCSPPGSSIHGIFQARVLEWAREAGRAPPRHAHGDLTSLAPHERLPEILVVPREKTPTGAAARGNP